MSNSTPARAHATALTLQYTAKRKHITKAILKVVHGSMQDAEDSMQDAIVRLLSLPPDVINEASNLGGLIYVTAKNLARNKYRNKALSEETLALLKSTLTLQAEQTVIELEEIGYERYRFESYMALAQEIMPPVRLKYFRAYILAEEGASIVKIARALDVNYETFKAHLRLALQQLKAAIKEMEDAGR